GVRASKVDPDRKQERSCSYGRSVARARIAGCNGDQDAHRGPVVGRTADAAETRTEERKADSGAGEGRREAGAEHFAARKAVTGVSCNSIFRAFVPELSADSAGVPTTKAFFV